MTFTASEKLLHLISYCIDKQWVSSVEIMEYLDCSQKQATRLMNKARDMQYEIGFYYADIIEGSNDRWVHDPRRIKIKLDKKYG